MIASDTFTSLHQVSITVSITHIFMCLGQTLGQANQHGQGGKPVSNILPETVDKNYGPMTARLVLSMVRFACLEEARSSAIGQLPQNLQDKARTVNQHASVLRDGAPDDMRRHQPDLVVWLTSTKDDWTALYDSIAGLLRAIWMRSSMIEARPVDCPIHR